LSNLLDNAQEAAVQCSKPYIRLLIERTDKDVSNSGSTDGTCGYLHIRTVNSCASEPMISSGLPVTTKNDKSMHGYGISNIVDITKKYEGAYIHNYNEGEYTADVFMYV